MLQSKFLFFVLGILSGILLFISWPPLPFTFFIFIAFLPLFYINSKIIANKLSILNYGFIFIAFLIWNIGSTHWICKMNFVGSLLIFIVISILLTFPFIISFYFSKFLKFKYYSNQIFIVILWLIIECLQEKWQLAWPFFTLGNGMSMQPFFIQWYEYSGVFSGSLWILLINFSLFEIYRNVIKKNKTILINISVSVFLIVIPIIFSSILYKKYKESGNLIEILVVHPYLNCYTQKYDGTMSVEQQIEHHLELSQKKITPSTDYILWPETAIPNIDWIELFSENKDIKHVREFIENYPKVKIITGAIGFEMYKNGQIEPKENEKLDLKYNEQFKVWYYTYNLAIQIDSSLYIPSHAKQKLVPFEERTPYPLIFKRIQNFVGSLGNFGFARREKDDMFSTSDSINVLPLICYESLFSEYTAKKVNKGANAIFVILNEGWYGSTFGSKQFLYISAVRAIENRRSIARSSNYGVSGFINQKGEIINFTSSLNADVIKGFIRLNSRKTFYSVNFDFLSKCFLIFSISIIGLFFILNIHFKTKN